MFVVSYAKKLSSKLSSTISYLLGCEMAGVILDAFAADLRNRGQIIESKSGYRKELIDKNCYVTLSKGV